MSVIMTIYGYGFAITIGQDLILVKYTCRVVVGLVVPINARPQVRQQVRIVGDPSLPDLKHK